MAVPFLDPGPFLLPLAFWPATYLVLALEVPFLGLALISPDAMAVRMSARVMQSSTSSSLSGFHPDPVLAAFQDLCGHPSLVSQVCHGHTILLRTLIPSSSALSSIAILFFVPTVPPMRTACFLGSMPSSPSTL